MIRVGIFGATSYSSFELIKMLLRHPQVEITYLGSQSERGSRIAEVFPALEGMTDLVCEDSAPDKLPEDNDLAFLTVPHSVAMKYVPHLLSAGFRVIDFTGDYRLKDVATYEKWYTTTHTDSGNLTKAVYGLPEIFADQIKDARLLANPGCYPTSAALGLAPLIANNLINLNSIIIDSKSGVSGAGNKPSKTYHFPECNESVHAYSVGVHKHTPEIAQALSDVAGREVNICFTPHLIPMDRGILSTIYANLSTSVSEESIHTAFANYYRGKPFIRLRALGSFPRTKDVIGSNFCDIGIKVVGFRVIIISCIDNLIKGASGQAVQNMNLMFGFEETEGLLISP